MIQGIGIDLIEIQRIKKAIERFGKMFLTKIFTEAEIEYCQTHSKAKYQHFAGRFAAKEAILKALGVSWPSISFRDIEIISDPLSGAPEVVLHGNLLALAHRLEISSIHLSISHTKEYAVAQSVCNKEK